MKSLITSLRRFSKRAIIRRRELIQRDIVVRPNPEMEKTAKLVDSLMTNADGVKPPQSLTKVDNLMSKWDVVWQRDGVTFVDVAK